MSFLITSTGRTGTKFLARLMNRSKQCMVKHQPDNKDSQMEDKVHSIDEFFNNKIPEWQQKRFNKQFYGEVNGALRYNFMDIQANKKGIIYRDYKEVILSFANGRDIRSTTEGLIAKVKDVNLCHNAFHKILEDNPQILLIDFNMMTTSKQYLLSVLRFFGIEDVDPNLCKVNSNEKWKYKTYNDLPKEVAKLVNDMNWVKY